MQISVIVPFFNNAECSIEQCLESLLHLSYPSRQYEIILVDNNSTDGSADIARRYPGGTLLSEPKQGSYAARNRGLSAAKGEIIAFTDADCVPAGDWLDQIAAAMHRPDVGIVLGSCSLAHDSLSLAMLAAYDDEKHRYIFSSGVKDLYYGHTNNMAVRRTLFSALGPFLEQPRGSDTVFVRRAVERYSCAAVCYCPEMRVRHLEVDRLMQVFRKYLVYGRSSRTYQRIAPVRSLSNKDRVIVFRRLMRRHGYSWTEAALLLGLLTIGLGFWALGSLGLAPVGQRVNPHDAR